MQLIQVLLHTFIILEILLETFSCFSGRSVIRAKQETSKHVASPTNDASTLGPNFNKMLHACKFR